MTLCKVCLHEESHKINEMLLSGVPARAIARQFGFNNVSVSRHYNQHLPAQLVKAKSLQDENQADDLLEKLNVIYDRAWSIVEAAEKDKKYTASIAGLKECRSCLELIGRLLGELKTGHTFHVYNNPEFIAVRATISEALLPYPEARQAVVKALEGEVLDEHSPGD